MKEENVWGRKLEEMIHVHVEVEKNIKNVVGKERTIKGLLLGASEQANE